MILRLLLYFILYSALTASELYHRAPLQLLEGVPITLEVITPATVEDPQYVHLYIRGEDQSHYQEVAFEYSEGTYKVVIPAARLSGPAIYYYITASFGTLGFLALPEVDPDKDPIRVPLVSFDAYKHRSKQAYDTEVIEDVTVIPWIRSNARPNKFPVLYLPKPSEQYQEMGYMIISGNEFAGVPDLLDAMLQTSRKIGAHAISGLTFGIYTSKPDLDKHKGVMILEGVYLQRKETD